MDANSLNTPLGSVAMLPLLPAITTFFKPKYSPTENWSSGTASLFICPMMVMEKLHETPPRKEL